MVYLQCQVLFERGYNCSSPTTREDILKPWSRSRMSLLVTARSYPAPFTAFSTHLGSEPGVAWQMVENMECGNICNVPKGQSMIATMGKDSFDQTPLSPRESCTSLSAAAQILYETLARTQARSRCVLELEKATY